MAFLSDKAALDAVSGWPNAMATTVTHPVPLKAIAAEVDPSREPEDPEVQWVIRSLLERGQLGVSGLGRVALTLPTRSSDAR